MAPPRTGVEAEWDVPTTVLAHTPGDEIFLGVLHPEAALFKRPFDIQAAAAEHRNYLARLRDLGVEVYTVVDTLLEGTVDERGQPRAGPKLRALQNLALASIAIDTTKIPASKQTEQKKYLATTLTALHPRELVRIVLSRPTIRPRPSRFPNTRYSATYALSPVMNLYFMRDPMITTAKGVVLGRMSSEQRAAEIAIVRFVLHKLGIVPIYEVTGQGRLEGGDYIPAGKTVFVGQGLRTNAQAVAQLLDRRVFGAQRVVVVKDPWQNQQQMHLDSYFNIIRPRLAVLSADRMDVRDESGRIVRPADPSRRSTIDVYTLTGQGYRRSRTDADLQQFLEKDMGMRLIPVSVADQRRDAQNFLNVGENRILAVAGASPELQRRLSSVQVQWLPFVHLSGGYGGPHCTVQVLSRRPAGALSE